MPRPAAAAPAAEFVAQSFAEPQETPADLSAPSGAAAADEQAQEDELPMMPLAAADAFAAADPVLALRAAEAEAEIVEADAAADDDADPYDLEAELGILLTSPAPAPEAELPAAGPIPAEPEIKLAAEPPAAGADFYFDDDEARPAEFAERRSADILPLAPRSFAFTEPSADATPEAADGPAALAADPIDDLLFESQMESELQALDEVAALEPEPAYAADPVAADDVAPPYVPAEAEEGPLAEERADWQPTEAEVFSDEEVLLAAPAEAETAVPAQRQPEAVARRRSPCQRAGGRGRPVRGAGGNGAPCPSGRHPVQVHAFGQLGQLDDHDGPHAGFGSARRDAGCRSAAASPVGASSRCGFDLRPRPVRERGSHSQREPQRVYRLYASQREPSLHCPQP